MSALSPPRSRSSQPAVDHQGFLGVVNEALQLEIAAEGLAPALAPILSEDYPKQREGKFDSQFDVILFRVHSSEMGATDPRQTRRPNGPQLRENAAHPTKARYRLVTYGWWEDSIVEFTILAKSNKRANELTVWFHRLMMRYGFPMQFFRSRGVSLFRFHKRLEDRVNKDFGQELYERKLQYQVRFEFLDHFEQKALEALHFEVGLKNEGEIGSFEYPVNP